ncbi:sodium channel modifier 1 isoform 1-T2 [Synchiropus picturatus]
MSFRREGDDKSQLNVLQKRRVADLLSNFIPEDEAVLLSNGRLSCAVCATRPVFDNVQMLAVHRRGRKHLAGAKRFFCRKIEIKNETLKKTHQRFIQFEESCEEPSASSPLLTRTQRLTHHALLKSHPYKSCHSNRRKPQQELLRSDASTDELAYHRTESSSSEVQNKHSDPEKVCAPASPLQAERKQKLEHQLKLKSAGWLQDVNGCWVKDPNVEFDSDEEAPPP